MSVIQLSSTHFNETIFRQTPNADGIWEGNQFTLNSDHPDLVWLAAYDHHRDPLETRIPIERRILFVSEPPEFQDYSQTYLDQFGILCSPYRIPSFKGLQIIGQTALQWFYGAAMGGTQGDKDDLLWQDFLKPVAPTEERDLELTAICSTKTQTKNQVRRLRFLKMLKAELGDRFHVYGRGFEPLTDKAEIINRSRYHLALENNLQPNGWTEKTADTILGGSFLIHCGAKEIENDFDPHGLLWVDLTKPREAVRNIVRSLDADIASSQRAQVAMASNKQRLMMEHNLFAVIHRLIQDMPETTKAAPMLIEPQALVSNKKTAWRKLAKLPKAIRRLVWQTQIALFETE